jgi:formyl-CoA transferase
MFATIGALAALQERAVSGQGQIVDSAIYESVLAVMESLVPEWEIAGYQRERTGSILPNIAPSNIYPTKDEKWILIAANQDTVFARLAELMGAPELATDERFATHTARGRNQAELDGIVADFTRTLDAADLEERLHVGGVPAGKIYQASDMLEDAHFQARETITRVAHQTFGEMHMQNVFPRLSRTRGQIRWPGAPLGSHTAEVLAEIGISEQELAHFPNSGASKE